MLKFEKVSDKYCYPYIEMLKEWKEDKSDLVPDLLEISCTTKEDYDKIIDVVNDTANGVHNDKDWYEKGFYYFVVNEQDKLIGAVAIRQNLTELGRAIWGNIAYGIRPSERRKGYAKIVAQMLVEKCKELGFHQIIACHYIENTLSKKVLESIHAKLDGTIVSEYSGKKIKRYIITIDKSKEVSNGKI